MWLLLALLPFTGINGEYWLSTPESYTALSSNIEVLYGIPASSPGLQLQLFWNDTDGEKLIAKRDVPQKITKGKIIFPCETIQRAGKFIFRLVTFSQDKVLAETKYLDVRWPEVTVHVPLMVETYSSNVIVQLYVEHLKCKPTISYATYIDLIYQGSSVDAWYRPTILSSKVLEHWMWDSSFDVTLNCELFDKAGNYTVHVRSDLKDAPSIATSDTILVMWSHRYSVSVAKRSVQPCDGSLSVIYHYPRCILDQDRIRIYGKALRGPMKYIRESRIENGKHATKLPCDIFQDEFQEYCFSFVSIARNGAVFDLKTHCIPTLIDSNFLATWSDWSPWSDCSSTCELGIQTRYRFCISPTNSSDCVGKAVQTQACKLKSCPEETTSKQPQLVEDCSCGCEINETETSLKLVIDGCDPDVIYSINVWPSAHVIVNIMTVTFPNQDYWLTIRDGKSHLGTVIALMGSVTSRHSVHSLSSTLRLEVHASNTTSIHDVEIILSVIPSEVQRESLAMVRHELKSIPSSSNLSAVHVTIIMLAVVLFSTTVFLVLIYLFRQLRRNTGSNATITSPEILTSTSELSIKSPSVSPEDYLYNSFLFRSSTSLQPKLKWDPAKVDTASTSSPVRRRGRPVIKNAQRESITPLTASVSELSTTGSEDGLEYDYYDYGCHLEPGSFFCPDPVLMGWPPFIPLPPQGMEEFGDYPLQHFTPSPEIKERM